MELLPKILKQCCLHNIIHVIVHYTFSGDLLWEYTVFGFWNDIWIQCHWNESIENGCAAQTWIMDIPSEVRRTYPNRIVIRVRNRYDTVVADQNEKKTQKASSAGCRIHTHEVLWIRPNNHFASSRFMTSERIEMRNGTFHAFILFTIYIYISFFHSIYFPF